MQGVLLLHELKQVVAHSPDRRELLIDLQLILQPTKLLLTELLMLQCKQ